MIQRIYNATIRPHLPRRLASCNGVTTRRVHLFDRTDVFPHYKEGLIDAVHANVTDGDHVVDVGGGWGITSTHAHRAGADHVTAYEPAEEMLDIYQEALTLERRWHRTRLVHAHIGPIVNGYGEVGDAPEIYPLEAEFGDVAVIDVEGGELAIIEEWGSNRPPIVVVETHPEHQFPAAPTRDALESCGYTVEDYPYMRKPEPPEKRILVGTTAAD